MTDNRTAILDRCGIAVSTACAVHCAAAPLAFGGLLAAPLSRLRGETAEAVLLTLSALIGFGSLTWAYRFRHRRRRCLATFAAGFLLLLAAEPLFHGGGLGAACGACGALCIAVAHMLNLKLCRACPDCLSDG